MEDVVTRVLSNAFHGLDECVLEYLVGVVIAQIEDRPETIDDLAISLDESVAPFLLSSDFTSDETTATTLCKTLASQLFAAGLFGANSTYAHLNTDSEIRKLDQAASIEEKLLRERNETAHDTNEELMARMWGFDRIRKTTNATMEAQLSNLSQRQIRKQVKEEKLMEEKELADAELDRQWEDAKFLPDLTGTDGKAPPVDIHVARMTINFKGKTLLNDTALKLSAGRRYGLVGKNGAGKTTLLRFMSHYEIEGFPRHLRMQHVEQESASKLSYETKSVLQVVLDSDYERKILLEEEKELMTIGETQKDLSEDEIKRNSDRLQAIYQRLIDIDSDTAESRARTILSGLQFEDHVVDGPARNLSGGWRMRTALAGALFMSPDLLLLDEPTNHLDLEAVIWLEHYLEKYEKTMIVVSHDRNFLNAVTTDTIHLSNCKLNYYKGDYNTFEKTQKELLRQQRKAYDAQQIKIKHMQDFIERFRANAKKAPLVQSRVKALDKILNNELIEEPEDEHAFRMHFPPAEPLGRPIIAVDSVTFRYPHVSKAADVAAEEEEKEHTTEHNEEKEDVTEKEEKKPHKNEEQGPILFKDVHLGIDMSSRIGILGVNGSGKSTLLNVVLGKLRPTSGHVTLNPRVRISTFSQHHVDSLDLSKSAVENMKVLYPGHENLEFRNHLGRFNISGELATKPTRTLSGGQKSRVGFAIMTWRLPHIVVLDEPTNHLDMETIDALIDALREYKGGVVVVSHDQHFVNKVCEELYVVGDQKLSRFQGTITEYKKRVLKA